MSGLTGRPALRRLGGATLCALLGLLWAAGPVAAQSVVFGTPSATSKFGQSIDFSQPYAGATVASADILIEEPGDVGPTELPLTSIGTTTLAYSLDTSGGALYPNTPVVAHFEVTLADGTIQDGPAIDITYVDDRYAWKTLVGKYVRLHWFQSSNSFAQQMLTWADDGVQKAAAFFGVTESQPIDFFVYPSESAFQQGLSQAETIGGVALSNIRTCFAAVAPGDSAYGQTVLPHEVTHIVFADASDNPYHSPPRWLNEGLAVYLSQGYDASDRQLVSQAAGNGTLRSLFAFADYFPLDASRIYLAYAEIGLGRGLHGAQVRPAGRREARQGLRERRDGRPGLRGWHRDRRGGVQLGLAGLERSEADGIRPAARSHGAAAARLERLRIRLRARRHAAADRGTRRRDDTRADIRSRCAAPRPNRGPDRLRRGRGRRAAGPASPRPGRLAGHATRRQGGRVSPAGDDARGPGLRRGCDDHLRL